MKTLIKYRRSAVLFLLMFVMFCLAIYSWADFFSRTQFLVAWTIFGLMWLAFLYGESKKLIAIILAALIAAPNHAQAQEVSVVDTEENAGVAIGGGIAVLAFGAWFIAWYYGQCKRQKANPPKRDFERMLEEMDAPKSNSNTNGTNQSKYQAANKSSAPNSCIVLADQIDDEGLSVILSVKVDSQQSRIVGIEASEVGASRMDIYQRMQGLGIPPDPYKTHYSIDGAEVTAEESDIEFLESGAVRIKGDEPVEFTIQTSMDLETWTDVQTFEVPSGMTGQIWVDGRSKQSYWRIAQ